MGRRTQTRACGVILLGKDKAGNIPSKSAEEIRDLWKTVGGLWMGKAERKTCEKWNSVALPKQEEAWYGGYGNQVTLRLKESPTLSQR